MVYVWREVGKFFDKVVSGKEGLLFRDRSSGFFVYFSLVGMGVG